MEGFLARYATYIYSIFRIVFGFMFMLHGTHKLLGWPAAEEPTEIAGIMVIGVIIMTLGGFMIMIGFFSSIAAFFASGMMAAAYFIVHQPLGSLPINNKGELAVAYCFAFLYIASRGSGVWSVDSIFKGSRSSADG